MGHAAVTDLANGRHVFSELLYRASPVLGGFGRFPDSTIAWSRGPAGTADGWQLVWNGAAFSFEAYDTHQRLGFRLTTIPEKPLVFQGPNGFSRKGSGGEAASQYYSFTRLATEGIVLIAGDTIAVTGQSWMDKEFGSNQLAEDQVGWDWFSLQLDDGREIMLYHLRSAEGSADYRRGTLVDTAGRARYLGPGDWVLSAEDSWRSQQSEGVYPAEWRITVAAWDLDLSVEPVLRAQENVSRLIPDLAYWEGAVIVRDRTGRIIGRGYVELTGYTDEGRLPI
jgi:predicted secreted hydrolase